MQITANRCKQWILGLIILGFMGCVGNFVGYGVPFMTTLPGMIVCVVIGFISILLKQVIKTQFPTIVYTSILAMLCAMPWSPIASFINPLVNEIKLMAIVTPILAYAGLTVGKDFKQFVKLGWKAVVVGLIVIFSTWFWSALIAQVLLKATGTI